MNDMLQRRDAEETWRLYFSRDIYSPYYGEKRINCAVGGIPRFYSSLKYGLQ